jgi:hypothetical protein
VILLVIIALFGMAILGMLLEHLHDRIRQTEDRDRAIDRHHRLMNELRRHQ